MSRSAWNFLVDCIAAGVFLLLLATASVIGFVFPRGTTAVGWRVFGLGYDEWCSLHMFILALFATIVLIHIVLHWTWILGFVTSRISRYRGRQVRINESAKTLYGVVTLITAIVFLGCLLLLAHISAEGPAIESV